MTASIQPHPLILASKSPRRAQLMREAGYQFQLADPPIPEPHELHPHVDPASYAESLAYFKAHSLSDAFPDQVILGADTIASCDGEIIGKPDNREHAGQILRKLSGTTHEVITGLALLLPIQDRRVLRHAVSTVRVRTLSDEMIENYLDTGAWQGKAGAYGIQDQNDPFVDKMTGSFTNVVGLPLELLSEVFEAWIQAS